MNFNNRLSDPDPSDRRNWLHAAIKTTAVAVCFISSTCKQLDEPSSATRKASVSALSFSKEELLALQKLENSCALGLVLARTEEDRQVFTGAQAESLSSEVKAVLANLGNNWNEASALYGKNLASLAKCPVDPVAKAVSHYQQRHRDRPDADLHLAVLKTVVMHEAKMRSGSAPGPSEWEQDYTTLHFSLPGDRAVERRDRFFQ